MAENNNENDEQIFNEDELQDIMNEFESLEREFHEGDEPVQKSQAPVQAATTEVVEEAEAEVEIEDEGELSISAAHAPASANDNVVSMAHAKSKAQPKAKPSAPTINAASGVTMSLEFPIGDQVAQIGMSPEFGFSFNMDGVELTIDADNGCVMTLPGGMTFTIPANSVQKSKKSA